MHCSKEFNKGDSLLMVMEMLKVWQPRDWKSRKPVTLSATESLGGDGVTRTQKPGPFSGRGLPGGDWEMAEPQPNLRPDRNTLTCPLSCHPVLGQCLTGKLVGKSMWV